MIPKKNRVIGSSGDRVIRGSARNNSASTLTSRNMLNMPQRRCPLEFWGDEKISIAHTLRPITRCPDHPITRFCYHSPFMKKLPEQVDFIVVGAGVAGLRAA